MQSGKSTLANILRDNHGFVVLRFGGPLKAMLDALLMQMGVDEGTRSRMIDGDLKETPSPLLAGRTPRHLMQTLGTEWGRDCVDINFWANAAAAKAKALMAEGRSVVFDDMRFLNEIQAVCGLGGHPIKIVRPVARLIGSNHPSEGSLDFYDGWEATVVNDGDLDTLATKAASLLAWLD